MSEKLASTGEIHAPSTPEEQEASISDVQRVKLDARRREDAVTEILKSRSALKVAEAALEAERQESKRLRALLAAVTVLARAADQRPGEGPW